MKYQTQPKYQHTVIKMWAERENETKALLYIYDGRIWMSFEDGKRELFFKKEYAETHIGLMLNMDWFQPYINSQYSVGVIYAVICNLPRSERFKPYNILTLAVIPGPKEPKKHEINNYLYPIINQLNRLWEGYHIKTYEYNNSRFIRGATIGCASDVPATRKLCDFISARIACYRCHKSANLVNNQPNFGGFEDIDDWFVERDINLIREKAREWKKCATEESRKAHVSQYHVRWSEVYQLPYFNSVRFCVVDPMYCLFLGVAKWIVMKLWINEGILNNEKLKIMQERADLIKFPSDLGRHPVRIATGDGFSNFTADMWKTPNLHLCLHICECALDYGFLSSFWCFSFEQMNGILGSYKNSKRNIEPELLKIMVESSFLNYYLTNCDSNILNTTLDIIKPRKSAESLAALDDFTSDKYQNFLRLSLIENESAYETERFPRLLMKPRQETCLPNRVLNLLVEFYNSLYEEHFVPIYSITGPNNDIVVISKIIQYGRIRIGADIFGSIQAAHHKKSSYILARFEQEDGTIDTYPGQVQFYFEHTIYLKNSSSLTHSLALVKWYRLVQDHRTRYFCQVDDDIKSCNIELWTNGFYDMSRDSIIPVHHILGKFIKCNFNIGTRKIKEYMAVIPLNKKISF
ncbi:hypothetical protein GLOIN_2v1776801 [Rhizophagus irregularis DAOM 181602=DAOM 197198]|nr:hypothetical protein GLOIN_2v1776801 [Rhizophagus irregularis DAOM 181602=DAOM 197198]